MNAYMLDDVAREVGVAARTISKWVRKGALPYVKRCGPMPAYDEAFVLRAKAVARLRSTERLGLPAIGERLDKASEAEIAYLAGKGPKPAAKEPPAPAAPPAPTASIAPLAGAKARWEHVCLHPGLELHLADGADETAQRMAAAILAMFGPRAPASS